MKDSIKNRKRIITYLITVLCIFSAVFICGCGKDGITLDDLNTLPEDGIVTEEEISSFAGTDRVVSFCGTDEDAGIEYIWELDGSKIKNPAEQNLKLTFITDDVISNKSENYDAENSDDAENSGDTENSDDAENSNSTENLNSTENSDNKKTELTEIKELANNAEYVLAVETYDTGLVCAPTLTIKIDDELNIDTAYFCKLEDSSLSVMSNIEISIEDGQTMLSMNVVELGDTYYIVGGLSEAGYSSGALSGNLDDTDSSVESGDGNNTEDGSNGDGSGENADSSANGNFGNDTTTKDSTDTDSSSDGTNNGSLSGSSADNANSSGSSSSGNTDSNSSSSKNSGSTGTSSESESTCTISINCGTILDNMDSLTSTKKDFVPTDGWILKSTTVTIEDDDTVHSVLQRVCKEKGIHMESSFSAIYGNAYVEGINQIYEFDCGELSGWMYSVNGWFPNYGCSEYSVSDGDVIKWVYTCDLGRDIGDNSLACKS